MGDKWIRRRASLGLGLLLVVASFALPRGARAADCELVNWPSEVAISVWVLQTSTSLIYPVSPPGELYTLGNDLDCFLLGWDPYLSFEQAPMDLNLGFGPAISVPGGKWTPFVGQCGSRREVESASQRYAAKDRDRIPA